MEILKKTHDKSYFKHFHIESPLANELFSKHSDYDILQIMPLSPSRVIAELVLKKNNNK